jgi:uncharacterized protein YwgA
MDAEVLAGLVKRAYPEFDLNSFDNRLKLQKFVYLLKSAGLDLGYSFNLYMRGPYCPDLTRDAFQIKNWSNIAPMKFDDERQEQRFVRLLDFIEVRKNNIDWLELATTLLLLKHLNNPITKQSVTELCQNKKQQFSQEEISDVYRELESQGLIT